MNASTHTPAAAMSLAPKLPAKSKTLATWIAMLGGGVGLHRFYLHGLSDWKGWLFPIPTFLGAIGIDRLQKLGQDDTLAWVLIPLGGVSLSAALLTAIVYGLTPDERWNERHNAESRGMHPSGWAAVIGVIISLLLGATVLLSTITVSFQHFFESQVEAARQISQ